MTRPNSPRAIAERTWQQAVASQYGIGIITTDNARARTQLYQTRQWMKDKYGVDLSNYSVVTSPENPACELYILRRVPTAAQTEDDKPAPPTSELG